MRALYRQLKNTGVFNNGQKVFRRRYQGDDFPHQRPKVNLLQGSIQPDGLHGYRICLIRQIWLDHNGRRS